MKCLKGEAYLILILVIALTLSGCSSKSSLEEKEILMGNIPYQVVNDSPEIPALQKDDFKSWYEDNRKNEGIYSFVQDTERFLLISAGEKPTAGYRIDNLKITGEKENIVVNAILNGPKPDEIVATVVTYPSLLIKIPVDARPLLLELEKPNASSDEVMTDSGRYVGQIDANSIEILISGVPEVNAAKAFGLSEELKTNFENLGLSEGDEIKFVYTNEQGKRPIITSISKIK